MAENYPYVSGVRSNLIEGQIKEESLPPSANTILILGTAEKGDLFTPTRLTPQNAEENFGENINDAYQGYNLMKGFHEITSSMPGTEVIGIRIGNAKKAKLDLYESQQTSGSYEPQSSATKSLTIKANSEGEEGNGIIVKVYKSSDDTYGVPSRLTIQLPDGVTSDFDLINDYTTPAILAAAINNDADASEYITAEPNVIEKSETANIVSGDVSGVINPDISLDEDNIIDITNVYTASEYNDTDSVDAGRTSAELAKTPEKSMDETETTINEFWTVIGSEFAVDSSGDNVSSVSPSTVKEVYLEKANTFDYGDVDPKFNESADDAIKDVKVYLVKSTGVTEDITDGTEVDSISLDTGKIVLSDYLEAGQGIKVEYKYNTTFTESKLRSSLEMGNAYNYFVTGNTIMFGGGQVNPLEVKYNTKTSHTISDVDLDAGTLTLASDGSEPEVGDILNIDYVFNPQLPAATGATISDTITQMSQLSGGSNGRKMSKSEMYTQLKKGYLAADNTPCSIVIPQGVYIDDTMEGLDYETGLPVTTNAGFHSQLSTFLARHSRYVSECRGIMSVKPMTAENPTRPTLEEKESWYNSLTNVSTTDGTRAANIISAINDYHLVVTVGDLLLVHPEISGGAMYAEGAHNIIGAMKLNHDNTASLTTRKLPGNLIQGMQYKIVAADRVNTINSMRYTLITEDSDTGDLKLASAPTAASSDSQFRKQYNLDVTIEAIRKVRRHLKKFIGEANKKSTRESMKRTAEQKLNEMSPDKLIDARVNIIADRTQAISGSVQVDLLLVTAVEIENINIRTRIELGI